MSEVHVFGIRHHGPGSARSLRQALADLSPDILLVEGPPEGEALLSLLGAPDMVPPVALLLYRPDQPAQAAIYPFAIFSPEWQAITYAQRRNIPVRLMDLPQAHLLALAAREEGGNPGPAEASVMAQDPLCWLAEAAGYTDGEAWWERMVEQRRHSETLFTAVLEAMVALREATLPEAATLTNTPWQRQEMLREAATRRTIRAAQQEGFARIAVVCGAWHAPVLVTMPSSAKADEALLKGLPKVKVEATWIPWTYTRLTAASGYGAGVASPRWYEHLWHHPEGAARHWCIAAAHLLRQEGFTASTAQVIDTVRLAETLTAVRRHPTPGLPELMDAIQATLVDGQTTPLLLIQRQLIVGEVMGAVPANAPTLPLQRDLAARQKRLRLPATETPKTYDLDLRQANDLERSHLWHRLLILDIPWGVLGRAGRSQGTFHEVWQVQWPPELTVRVIEAAVWGNTVAEAAAARAIDLTAKIDDLPTLTDRVNQVLLADLPAAAAAVVARLETLAALTSDTAVLMEALPPLAHMLRYGNVRQTDAAMVSHVVAGLVTRICIGLPGACASLNDEAATEMHDRLLQTAAAISLLQDEAYLSAWQQTLGRLVEQVGLHGLLAGRCCRLLLDGGVYDTAAAARHLWLALSPAAEPAQAGAWLEGFLRGSGTLLLHDDRLWQTIDSWVARLPGPAFQTLLPLLRRTFATFPAAERRQMGRRARRVGGTVVETAVTAASVAMEHVPLALSVVAQLLGLAGDGVATTQEENS